MTLQRGKGALFGLLSSLILLTACADDSAALRDENARLKQENQRAMQQTTELREQLVSSFDEQCIAGGYGSAHSSPDAVAGLVLSPQSHPEGECLDCHESHGKPVCSNCHEMDGEGSAGQGLAATGFAELAPSFAQPADIPRVGDIDGLTGASGDYYYGSSSYLNASYLASRVNGMSVVYSWKPVKNEGSPGIILLSEACQLPERSEIEALFPDDGKSYRLSSVRNQMGAKLVSTVNHFQDESSGEWLTRPNIATFGYGMLEEGGKFFVTLDIGKNNSCYNAITNGDMRFSYYEYDATETQKHERNRGARIIGRVDYKRTSLKASDWKTELPGLAAGTLFAPDDVEWDQVVACSLVVEIVGIIPLG